jgi:hypothetical protein
MAAILTGRELGIGEMQALRGIHIVEGKPTLAAELQRALILAAGHHLWTETSTSRKVTLCGQRAGDDHTHTVTWEWADAERAGLVSKANWRRYPRQMLLARATSELARLAFADVTAGMYAPEDFDATAETTDVSEDTPKATAKRRRPTKTKTDNAPTAAPSSPTTTPSAPPLPPLPHEVSAGSGSVGGETGKVPPVEHAGGTEPAIQAELIELHDDKPRKKADITAVQRLVIHCQKSGLDDKVRHELAAHVTRGRATSFNDLTDDELAVIRSIVDDMIDGTATLSYDPTGGLVITRTGDEPPF